MKGGKRERAGRPKGTPNKTTQQVKELFAKLLCDNENQIQSLFDRVAIDNPAKAIELFLKMSEFVLPKPKAEIKETTYTKPQPMFGNSSLVD